MRNKLKNFFKIALDKMNWDKVIKVVSFLNIALNIILFLIFIVNPAFALFFYLHLILALGFIFSGLPESIANLIDLVFLLIILGYIYAFFASFKELFTERSKINFNFFIILINCIVCILLTSFLGTFIIKILFK